MHTYDTLAGKIQASGDSQMTILSKEMFESALHIASVEDAINVLMHYRNFRTLKDILLSFGSGEDIRAILVDGLLSWQPKISRESVERKVRNWLNGKTTSIHKQDAFVLSRILKLSLERTNEFLKMASGEGIHWRNPEDIVWCYAIVRDLEPAQILRLLGRVRAIGETPKVASHKSYTQEVHEQLQNVLDQDEDSLIAVLKAEWSRFGTFHNTAHHLFTQYSELLKKGYRESDKSYMYAPKEEDDDKLNSLSDKNLKKWKEDHAELVETARREAEAVGEPFLPDQSRYQLTLEDTAGTPEIMTPEEISDEKMLEDYLYRKLIPVGNQEEVDPIRETLRRAIRQNWPDTTSLSRMRKRQIDIPRKALILLFLATDGNDSEFESMEYGDFEEAGYAAEDSFLDIYTRLNLMLTSCGFLKLDPRSAFDWIVLFCISTGDLWDSDERIQGILLEMFPKEN